MLLEHLDELPLREHDLGGSPAALMSRVVARIDRLKDIASTPSASRRGRMRPTARGSASSPSSTSRTERLLVEADALDAGDLVLRALRPLRDRPHVRARVGARHRHVLVDDLQYLLPRRCSSSRSWARDRGGTNPTPPTPSARSPTTTRRSPAAPGPPGATRPCSAAASRRAGRPPRAMFRARTRPNGACAVIDAIPTASRGRSVRRVRAGRGALRHARTSARSAGRRPPRRAARPCRDPAGGIAVPSLGPRRGARDRPRARGAALPHRLIGVDAFFGAPRCATCWRGRGCSPTRRCGRRRARGVAPADRARSVDLAAACRWRRRRLDMVAALVAADESPQIRRSPASASCAS